MTLNSMHAAPVAKARVMMGYLINDEMFEMLTKQSSDVEVIRIISKLPQYQSYLTQLAETGHAVEIAVKQSFFSSYEKLYHYYVGDYRQFFKALLLRYEVENIKFLIRKAINPSQFEDLRKTLLIPSVYRTHSYDALLKCKTLTALLEGLAGTPYADMIKPYANEEPSKMLFHMEMILDRYYFNNLRKQMMTLHRNDQQLMLKLLGINIDLLNIQWIYRGIHYFSISPEEIFNFTLNGGDRYDYKTLKILCYSTLEMFRSEISKEDYGVIFKSQDYLMEREMERYLYYEINKPKYNNTQTLATPVVFLFKFEYEIRDLLTILEAIRLRASEIESYLIRDLRRSEHGH